MAPAERAKIDRTIKSGIIDLFFLGLERLYWLMATGLLYYTV